MEGWLRKWVNLLSGWEYRYFHLDTARGVFSYYLTDSDYHDEKVKDSITLGEANAKIGIDDEDDCQFYVINRDKKVYYLQANNSDDRHKWIQALEDSIYQKRSTGVPVYKSYVSKEKLMSDIDDKLAEANEYLAVLISRAATLDSEIAALSVRIIPPNSTSETSASASVSMTASTSQVECPNLNQLLSVKKKVDEMIESVRQGVTYMAVAKESLVRNPQRVAASAARRRPSSTAAGAPTAMPKSSAAATAGASTPRLGARLHPTDGASAPSRTSSGDSKQRAASANLSDSDGENTSNSVPALRESSSDGEYVDAEGVVDLYDLQVRRPMDAAPGVGGMTPVLTSSGVGVAPRSPPVSTANGSAATSGASGSQPLRPFADDEYDDYDKLYEDGEEEELDSIDNHGGLVRHLLSQVRIGMDLTRIVLPTFILEKRSLLEMFADFLAHPELFASIPDAPDVETRFVSVVRWYMSAFHAGRKSEVAKKPYNPILGETFRCYFDIPDVTDTKNRAPPSPPGGPVDYAFVDTLNFLAEQVSHHPPISAFYAECPKKRLCVDGHIWTKSKFLGLSVGVDMVGSALLSVMDRGEEYRLTFPTAYGRSIITTPWIELGGSAEIVCQQTGYRAKIQFKTVPLLLGSSAKHRVEATLYRPNVSTKKPFDSSFMTVEGEWNGRIIVTKYDKHPTFSTAPFAGKVYSKSQPPPHSWYIHQVFVDTIHSEITPKTTAPIRRQLETESRRMWRHVTEALSRKDVQTATLFKHQLEQKQRDDAAERKGKGVTWRNLHFDYSDDHYAYRRPLFARLESGGADH